MKPTMQMVLEACIKVDRVNAQWFSLAASMLDAGPLSDESRIELADMCRRNEQVSRDSMARNQEWLDETVS